MIKLKTVNEAFSLLPQGTKERLALLIGFQILSAALDLIALYLLGALASVGVLYIQNQVTTFPFWLVKALNLNDSTFNFQFVSVSAIVVVIFLLKTSLAIWGNHKILIFLGNRAAIASFNFLSKLLASKPDYILRKNSQELLYAVTAGIDNLALSYIAAACTLITEVFFLIIIISGVLVFSPSAGIIAIIVFGFSTLFINRVTARGSKSLSEKSSRIGVQYREVLLETFLVYRELLLRNQLAKATQEIQFLPALTFKIRAQLLFLPNLSKYLFEFSIVIGGTLVGLSQVILSDATSAVASSVIFIVASTRILPALIRAQNSMISMRNSEGGARVTLEVIQEINNISEAQEESYREKFDNKFVPSVYAQGLTFSYPGSDQLVLEDISFSIKEGQFVAVVGQSGSGKSTLVDLMLGMYKPNIGELQISGLTPREAIRAWPGLISYVPQDIAIIGGTIAKNISLQQTDQDLNQILRSLETANLLGDVTDMGNKYEEVVGERGTRLSGGQRQRLGIARALYTNPKLICFDEATSSLDPLTEKSVTDSIYNKKNGVTLIVIAHRLSTVRHADLVLFLDQGRLVAKGTFDEVRALAPKFDEQAKLVNI